MNPPVKKISKRSNGGRPCKTCLASFRSEVDLQILSGVEWSEIIRSCNDRGLNVTKTSLVRHAENHIENYVKPERSERLEYVGVEQVKSESDEIWQFNRSKILNELGLTDFDDLTPEKHYEVLTRSLDRLTIETCFCALNSITMYQAGKGRFPSEQVSTIERLMKIFEMLQGRSSLLSNYDPGRVEQVHKRRNRCDDLADHITTLKI